MEAITPFAQHVAFSFLTFELLSMSTVVQIRRGKENKAKKKKGRFRAPIPPVTSYRNVA